jgi:hypothetical protein
MRRGTRHDQHGVTSTLSAADIDDLISHLPHPAIFPSQVLDVPFLEKRSFHEEDFSAVLFNFLPCGPLATWRPSGLTRPGPRACSLTYQLSAPSMGSDWQTLSSFGRHFSARFRILTPAAGSGKTFPFNPGLRIRILRP